MSDDRKLSTLRLTPELNEWIEAEAKRIGVPKNALIVMALQEKRENAIEAGN